MSKILPFPPAVRQVAAQAAPAGQTAPSAPSRQRPFVLWVLSKLMRATYYVAVILWPLLRLLLIIDIVIQGFRWLITMAAKGPYWDMTFFAHYGFAMLLICIIYGYRP